ncbi:hydroxyacylglutathione hydrolase [Plasmodium vivax India VII]|uniref:Glyoxalase II, putative n=6 Tax=Plasmodium vivax TaxID=5855 RepID=A5K0F6_PLAVS|nr:glyoxalase II, putative [Plasmodium vivax]KMZ78402.1 hydroxyacylglutathione hydrolase [Plasmodium vivax India VII]KMZ83590.1 hydroxyacylglutathione hydrolase [Plasmodium vivax Brazil I]KMZ91038.1 hydroxyacylglutathione hydrolase [Plasmodium vivax Mauritania I]KMZ97575.1 hydroxyacylglutathione hydrolase [Plasmodium vivax North Korean]EDL46803.1 glyoxalase II, putative [Plasmodium vivax]|eukprot:XP_001616530.1 glyoxalase II [Plasmodium vivax Sal-1]
MSSRLFFERGLFSSGNIHSTRFTKKDKKYFIVKKPDICTNVIIVPMYRDNYAYIFYDDKDEGVAVDPSDHNVVNEIAEMEKIKIKNVLCTHKHADHNGGNSYFFNKKINVYGIKEKDNKYINSNLQNVKTFQINNFKISTFLSHFHCNNHISYLVENAQKDSSKKKIFFTGDFLFICGLGKNFEGNNFDLHNSVRNLKSLQKDAANIYVFCGHEYTQDNVKFALSVDGVNPHLAAFHQQLLANEDLLPTVPSLLQDEFAYNPFLRCDEEYIQNEIKKYAKRNHYVISAKPEYISLLRVMKDNFKCC